jgi:superfamily II DNA helicase RecQ
VAQGNQKQQQLDLMLRFAESNECRMTGLVRHFGDFAGARQPCGICDFCAPEDCAGQRFRAATKSEQATAEAVLASLRKGGKSTGRLYTELNGDGGMTRDAFEELLGAMARAGLVRLAAETFEKDGKSIPYRKAMLLEDRESFELLMKADVVTVTKGRKRKTKAEARGKRKRAGAKTTAAAAAPDAGVAAALRIWRLAEAKRHGVPAFRIFSDRALDAMATTRPGTAAELLAIPGIGISTVEKYGAQLYRLLHAGGA